MVVIPPGFAGSDVDNGGQWGRWCGVLSRRVCPLAVACIPTGSLAAIPAGLLIVFRHTLERCSVLVFG